MMYCDTMERQYESWSIKQYPLLLSSPTGGVLEHHHPKRPCSREWRMMMHLLLFVYDHRPEKEPFPLFFAFANERFFEERLLLFPNTMMPTQKKARSNLAPKRSSCCVSSFFVRKENDDAFFLSIGKMRHFK